MCRPAAEKHTRTQPHRAKFFKASYLSQLLLKILHMVHALQSQLCSIGIEFDLIGLNWADDIEEEKVLSGF